MKKKKCPECGGIGHWCNDLGMHECEHCDGEGYIAIAGNGNPCPECKGKRYFRETLYGSHPDDFADRACPTCNGTRQVKGEPAGENMDWYEPCLDCERDLK